MSIDFYRAFEDRHRGSRELILGRLEVYLPFVEQLKEVHNACTALDLGCGRGEWLELLQRHGVDARGVDLDEGMLRACRERELKVEQRDAVETLQSLPDNSLSVVSGFHIVEHIEFDQLQQLVTQSLRVLRPGGLLILETPNAENLVVGSHNFFLDPTHIRPMPHTLLAFVTEHGGFARNKVLRLQESPELRSAAKPSLIDVLGGVSPDYAIVAQKPAEPEITAPFDDLFGAEYGISLNHLAERYQKALDSELTDISTRIEKLAQQEQELSSALAHTNERLASDDRHTESLQTELRKVELRSAQLEVLSEQLRHQMLQAMKRAHQEETRAREAEAALRESIVRTAQLDARFDATQTNNHALSRQIDELTKELLDLTRRYNKLEIQLEHSEQQLTDSLGNAHNWWLRATQLEEQLASANQQLQETQANAHHWHTRASAAEQRAADILASTSWRVTAPLRGLRRLAGWLLALPIRALKACLRPLLAVLMRNALRRPALRQRIADRLRAHPRLFAHLRQFAVHRGLLVTPSALPPTSREPAPSVSQQDQPVPTEQEPAPGEAHLMHLTPHARQIYADLRTAIEKNKKGQN